MGNICFSNSAVVTPVVENATNLIFSRKPQPLPPVKTRYAVNSNPNSGSNSNSNDNSQHSMQNNNNNHNNSNNSMASSLGNAGNGRHRLGGGSANGSGSNGTGSGDSAHSERILISANIPNNSANIPNNNVIYARQMTPPRLVEGAGLDLRPRKFSSGSEQQLSNLSSNNTPTDQDNQIDILASYASVKSFHKKVEIFESYWLFSVYMYPSALQFYIFDLCDHCFVTEIPIQIMNGTATVNCSDTSFAPNLNTIPTAATTSVIAKTTQVFHNATEAVSKKMFRISRVNHEILKCDFFNAALDPQQPNLTNVLLHKMTGDFQFSYFQFLVSTLYTQLQDALFEKSIGADIFGVGGGLEQISDLIKGTNSHHSGHSNRNDDLSEDSGITDYNLDCTNDSQKNTPSSFQTATKQTQKTPMTNNPTNNNFPNPSSNSAGGGNQSSSSSTDSKSNRELLGEFIYQLGNLWLSVDTMKDEDKQEPKMRLEKLVGLVQKLSENILGDQQTSS